VKHLHSSIVVANNSDIVDDLEMTFSVCNALLVNKDEAIFRKLPGPYFSELHGFCF